MSGHPHIWGVGVGTHNSTDKNLRLFVFHVEAVASLWERGQLEDQQSQQYIWKTICLYKIKGESFLRECFGCTEKLGLRFPLEYPDKVKAKSPHRVGLTLMPFDAPDMFAKPKVRLCIEVIIF